LAVVLGEMPTFYEKSRVFETVGGGDIIHGFCNRLLTYLAKKRPHFPVGKAVEGMKKTWSVLSFPHFPQVFPQAVFGAGKSIFGSGWLT